MRLIDAPAGFVLAPLPDGVAFDDPPPYDVMVLFCGQLADLDAGFDAARAQLTDAGGLWVAWPKKSSGVPTDLDDFVVREFGLSHGLVDNKVCAIDGTWSGLRFVHRLEHRPGR